MSVLDALDIYDKTERLESLPSYSSDYVNMEQKVKQFFKYYPNLEITGVSKVHNSYLQVMYDFKKIEYQSRYPGIVKEYEFFHSTNNSKVGSIIKDNFDWRRVSRTKYGMGTSFSNNADYANCHANRQNGFSRAMVICNVLVARKIEGSGLTTIPPPTFDTTGDANDRVYVKYQDNEFLPKFVVYYDCPDDLISKSSFYTKRYKRHGLFWL